MTSTDRGYTDDNFAASDGSVQRVDRIDWDRDKRMGRVPIDLVTAPENAWIYLPLN